MTTDLTETLAAIQGRVDYEREMRDRSFQPVLQSQTQYDRDRLLRTLQAVVDLHEPMTVAMSVACSQCTGMEGLVSWPCPTIRTIDDVLAGRDGA